MHEGLVSVGSNSSTLIYYRTYEPAVHPSVAFLRACRQIYTEAALLTFAINVFALPVWNGERTLLCTLNPDQYQAIGKVQIACGWTRRLEGIPCLRLAYIVCDCPGHRCTDPLNVLTITNEVKARTCIPELEVKCLPWGQ